MHGTRTTVIAVLALTIAATAAHGVVTSRWSGGRDADLRMPEIPNKMGDWIGSEDEKDDADPGLIHFTRRYSHVRTGRSMVISLTVGHPGLTAVHTPEYCYRGSGYDLAGAIERRPADVKDGSPATFWTTQFEKKTAAGTEQLRIFWSWSAGQGWTAPDHPRLHFLGRPSIFKLYVVVPGQVDISPGKDALLDDFLSTLIGSLNQALFLPPVPRPG